VISARPIDCESAMMYGVLRLPVQSVDDQSKQMSEDNLHSCVREDACLAKQAPPPARMVKKASG
jgi:hypothetical protein